MDAPRAIPPVPEAGQRLRILILATFITVDLLLVAVCTLAFRQNLRLRRELGTYAALLMPAKGTVLPDLVGRDLKGALQTIRYGEDSRPTLVYTFSRGCPACQENWRAMRTLQAFAPSSLRIIYLDTSGDTFPPGYLTDNGIAQSALLTQLASPIVAAAYDARAVPQTLLIDSNG